MARMISAVAVAVGHLAFSLPAAADGAGGKADIALDGGECPLMTQSGQGATPGRRLFYHPCFAARLGGVSGGKETHGWRDSSHTAMVGAGKFESAKLPMATATYPGKPSPSQ
jgi:hypothetical protein